MRTAPRSRQQLTVAGVVIPLAICAGALIAVTGIPSLILVGIVLLLGGVGVLLTARQFLSPRAISAIAAAEATITASTTAFALSRCLFFVGCISLAVLTLRPAIGFTLSDWVFFASLGVAMLSLLTSIVTFLVIGMGASILFQRYCWIAVVLMLALRQQQPPTPSQSRRTSHHCADDRSPHHRMLPRSRRHRYP